MSAASMTLQAGGTECKPRGPCSGSSCACESEKSVVALKQEREEDEAGEKDDGAVDVEKLQQELIDLTETLLAEEVLDQQFTQLQQLQDESNPEFVSEVVSLFFEDSERLLEELTESLKQDPINYVAVDAHVHQFKGSSSSCQKCLEQLKQEFALVKSKLEHMFELEQQILAAGGSLPYPEEEY